MASIGPFPNSSTVSFASSSTASSSSSTTSSSSSSSCIVPISSNLVEVIARDILREVKRKFINAYAILPQIPNIKGVSLVEANLKEYYEQFGQPFLIYLQYYMYLQSKRNVANSILGSFEAVEQLEGGPEQDPTLGLMAIAKHGIGEDGEPAIYAAAKCALQDVPVIHITAVSSSVLKRKSKQKTKSKHTFLLLGVGCSEFLKLREKHGGRIHTIHTILEGLPHGVLLDPYLKLVCPLDRIAKSTEGLEFSNYMNVRSFKLVEKICMKSKEEWQTIEKEAEGIFNMMQEQEFPSTSLVKAERYVRKLTMLDIEKELKRIFPELKWEMNVETGKIWVEGSPEEINQASASLQEKRIQTNIVAKLKKSRKPEAATSQCFVEDLDLMRLRLLSSTSSYSSHIPVQTSIHYAPFQTPTSALTSCPLPCLSNSPYLRRPQVLPRQGSVVQTITSPNALDSTSFLPQSSTSSRTVDPTLSLPPVPTTVSSQALGSTLPLPSRTMSSHSSVSNLTLPRLVTGNAPVVTRNEGKESRY